MIDREDLPPTPEWQLPPRTQISGTSEAPETIPESIELGEN